VNFNQCASCGQRFRKCPRVRGQEYCSEETCQRERRRRWQKRKRRRDPAYRENQREAGRAWARRNRAYWPEYRRKQKEANSQRAHGASSDEGPVRLMRKIFVPLPDPLLASRNYRLIPVAVKRAAKMDVITVEIAFTSNTLRYSLEEHKETTR
jgi:hypothetical protein